MLRSHAKVLIACLGLFCCGPLLGAADLDSAPLGNQEYRVSYWTAERGLPQNTIKALAQTGDGYLWVGTLRGLSRFDGIRFKTFDHNNTPEITHDSINDLAADSRDNSLWIGTGKELLHYENHRFQRFGSTNGVLGAVGVLCPASQGGVWFSPRDGEIALARKGGVTRWEFGPEGPDGCIHALVERSPGEMLVLLGDGKRTCRIELQSGKCIPLDLPPGAGFCIAGPQTKSGHPCLLRSDGLWVEENSNWTPVLKPSPGRILSAAGLARTHEEEFWIAQSQAGHPGLFRISDRRVERINAPELGDNLNVNRVLEDREGSLWVGTTTALLRLEPKRLRVFSLINDLGEDEALGLTGSPDGTIWVATDKGISAICQGKVSKLPPPAPGAMSPWPRKTTAFAVDTQNRLWIGREPQGLNWFQAGHWNILYTPEEWNTGLDLVTIYSDRGGRIWAARPGDIFCYDNGSWANYSIPLDPPQADVRTIHQDRHGDMWFGTFGGGLVRLHAGRLTRFRTNLGDYNNRAWWIHEDSDGVFWIATEGGLNRFTPPAPEGEPNPAQSHQSRPPKAGEFFTFTTRQGLYDNALNNIQEDDFGNLWLSGLLGIYRVSRQELNDVASGKRAQVSCLVLGEADGMISSECNGGDNQPSGYKDAHGRIFFPTTKGVVEIDSRQISPNKTPPPVVIEQVKANDLVVWGDDTQQSQTPVRPTREVPMPPVYASRGGELPGLRLGAGRARVLEIRYTANTFAAPERARFKFRLEGWDPDWQRDDSNRRTASYTNLKPGNYKFRVAACNNDGVWNESGAELALSIAPHLYETTPFYAGCSALLLAMALGVHYWRIKGAHRLQRLEHELALDQERARIARDLHDDLGSRFLQISVLGELSQRSINAADQAGPHLEKLRATTAEAFQALDEIVWAANPKQDSLEGLVSYLREYTPQFLGPLGIKCRLDLPNPVPVEVLGAELRHHLFLAVKEALQNVAKHAQAKEVVLRFEVEQQHLRLTIKDDGCGFDSSGQGPSEATGPALGNGLVNMCDRMERIGGRFSFQSSPGHGTEIVLEADV